MIQVTPRPEYEFPKGRFFLLWGLALLMGGSLLWLHQGFTKVWWTYMGVLLVGMPVILAFAMTRPRWRKVTCSWCGAWGRFLTISSEREDPGSGGTVVVYECGKCGHKMEKIRKSPLAVGR